MALSWRSSSAGNNAGTTVATVTPTLPTGWAARDLVYICVSVGAVFTSPVDPAGWTCQYDTNADSTGRTILAYRQMQAGDTAPVFSWTGAGKCAWTAVCIQPVAGQQAVHSGLATPSISATATSHTPPAYAAGAASGISVLLTGYRAGANAATAITSTAPTSWTEPATNADTSTATGTSSALRQVASWHAYRINQTGTITPAAYASSVTALSNKYHVFAIEQSVSPFLPPQPKVLQWAAVDRAHNW